MRKLLIGIVIGMLVAGGTATAASVIDGHNIKHRSIPPVALEPYAIYGSKLHAGSITYSKLGRTVKGYLAQHSAQGPKESQGPQGPKGATGATGAPGQALAAIATTPPNPAIQNHPVVAVESKPTSSTAPDATDQGTKLVSTTLNAGIYLVTGTAQFFNSANDTSSSKFGVARLFLGSTTFGGQIWTPAIPAAPQSVAQTNGTTVVAVAKDDTTLSLNAVIRGTSLATVYGKANIIVTKIAPSP